MTEQLFIPKKIKVGYQEREDTYTNKLAYIIYYDTKGKLRKETSWNQWRDKKINPNDFENKPTEGFVLNKEARRCNWSHFSSNRSYIRIYDPRGMEFEISPDNLIGILMETNCDHRMLEGKFVYAWLGTTLVLLPCGSENYKEASEYTKRVAQKVSARDLKLGCSYTLKDGNEVIYLGYHPWYSWDSYGKGRTMKKRHVFWNGEKAKGFTGMQSLAHINSEEPVHNFAEIMESTNSDPRMHEIISWEFKPNAPTDIDEIEWDYTYNPQQKFLKYDKGRNRIVGYVVNVEKKWDPVTKQNNIVNYCLAPTCHLDLDTFKNEDLYWRTLRSQFCEPEKTKQDILEELKDSIRLFMVLDNKKEVELENITGYYLPGYRE